MPEVETSPANERKPFEKSHKRHPGRPTNAERAKATEDTRNFFQSLDKVHPDEWGSRFNVYVYRQEPLIDKTRAGEPKYIMCYAEPISEDRLLKDHGSGRYMMILNFRKAGDERGQEVDRGYCALLNNAYPPKVEPGEWVDDPRNKQWAWAKKHFPPDPAANGGAADPLKTLETFTKIRQDIAADMKPTETAAGQMLTLATVLEKLAPKTSSPDEVMKNIGTLIAQLKPSDDKLTSVLLQQNSDLMKAYFEAKHGPEKQNGLAMVREVVTGFKDLVPEVQRLIPGMSEGKGAARSRMTSWQEFTVALAPHVSTIFGPFVSLLMSRMQGAPGLPPFPAPPPALPPGTPAGTQGNAAPPSPVTMMPFLQMVANPMLNYVREMAPPDNCDPQQTGEDFAAWVYEGFGASPHYSEAIAAVRLMGPIGVIAAFRSTPWWTDRGPTSAAPSMSMLESQLYPFFTGFLNWTPRPAEDEEEEEDEQEFVPHTASEKGA